MQVVGLGTQDSLDLAQTFVARHELGTPLMVWDQSFETWQFYQVAGQPRAALIDADGEVLGSWFGLPGEVFDIADGL